MGDMRNAYNILVRKCEVWKPFREGSDVDGRKVLK
jgi:hypothetical protein